MVDQRTTNDERLSFRARGILSWLLDKPDDWTCNSDAIARASTGGLDIGTDEKPKLTKGEGRDAVRAALNELEAAGYLRRQRKQKPDGTWITETEVHERPLTEDGFSGAGARAEDGNPVVGEPGVGAPGVGGSGPTQGRPPRTETKDPAQELASTPARGDDRSGLPAGDRAKAAAWLLAQEAVRWRIVAGATVTNPDGLATHIAVNDVWPEDGERLTSIAAGMPDWTPQQIANALTETIVPDVENGISPDSAYALYERAEADRQAWLDAPVELPDPETVKRHASAARAALDRNRPKEP